MRHAYPIRTMTIAATLGVACAASLSAAPLRAQFTEGASHRYALTQSTAVNVMDQETNIKSQFTYLVETISVGDDSATVRVTIDQVSMDMAQDGTSVSYDSDEALPEGEAESPLAGALAPVIGAVMTLELAPNGEVASVDDSVIRDNPVLAQLLEPESQRRSLSRLFRVEGAPDAIVEGDTWSITMSQPIDQVIGVQFTHAYAVESIKDGVITLALSGDSRLTISDDNLPQEMRPELTLHELSGKVVWNEKDGKLESYAITTDFTIAGMNPQLGQRVEARLRQEQTLSRLNDTK